MGSPFEKILVVGSGGREHALIRKIKASPLAGAIHATPGNGGIAADATLLDCGAEPAEIVAAARAARITFAVVGPEVPLCAGIVDQFADAGIPAFGPTKEAARFEGSKAFTKEFLEKYDIPTARARSFTASETAISYLSECAFPVVIKASGLAAGKGVIIAQSRHDAELAIRSMLDQHAFGDSGATVLVEDFLDGEEASIHLIVSGKDFLLLPSSQDHKRALDGDEGPNTGGMGAYAPADIVTGEGLGLIQREVIQPTIDGMLAEGIDFRGCLYIGLMLTAEGPKVLEFNVRFGDPETQVLLPLVQNDLLPVLHAAAIGKLAGHSIQCAREYGMVVVLAANGYPGSYKQGDAIGLPDSLPTGVDILHAGTRLDPKSGKLLSNGGRVLGVTAKADNLAVASTLAYQVIDMIDWPGAHFRTDIGHRQLNR